MFLAFLSLTVVGVALLIAVIIFSSKKDVLVDSDFVVPDQVVQNKAPIRPVSVQEPETSSIDRTDRKPVSDEPEVKKREAAEYIPILRITEEIPGIKGRELVHYAGEGALYSLESTDDLKNIEIKSEDLELVVEGKLFLTSRYIIIYSGETVKKFTIAAIESFRFSKSLLIMKRKRVKTKKDILKIGHDLKDFKYILHALT
jgi:hypothetical protein